MNLIDDYGRRWMFMVCFVILSTAVVDFSFGYNLTQDKDKDWHVKYGWTEGQIQISEMRVT